MPLYWLKVLSQVPQCSARETWSRINGFQALVLPSGVTGIGCWKALHTSLKFQEVKDDKMWFFSKWNGMYLFVEKLLKWDEILGKQEKSKTRQSYLISSSGKCECLDQISTHFTLNHKCQPHGGSRRKVKGSPEDWSSGHPDTMYQLSWQPIQ